MDDVVTGIKGKIPADVLLRYITSSKSVFALLPGFAGPLGAGIKLVYADGRESWSEYTMALAGTVPLPEGIDAEPVLAACRALNYEPVVIEKETQEHERQRALQSDAYWKNVQKDRYK